MSKASQSNVPMTFAPVDVLWLEFRSSPHQYLSSKKCSIENFVHELLQVRSVAILAYQKSD